MSKYPVEIPYSFTVDLNIKEQHIPFVQVSVVTNNVEEETIEFAPDTKSFNYRDTFYIYGDDTLLYFGDPIKRVIHYSASYPQFLGGWIREKWRAKYLVPEIYYGYNFVNWYEVVDDTDTAPRLGWVRNHGDPSDKYWLKCPPIGTYSTITMKRNTGITFAEAQAVNSSYNVPNYYTFLNLTRCEYQFSSNGYAGERNTLYANFEAVSVPHYFYSSGNPTREIYVPRPTENINMSKVWLQVGLGRYRLKVYGKFYKWTNQQIKSTVTYPIGTYTFVRGEAGEDDYIFSSKVESTGTLNLYEPEPNPCNVRLLVSYLNNSGQNEIREYSL